MGSGDDGGCTGDRRGRKSHGGHDVHDREPRESGNGQARTALSLDRTGSNPFRPISRSEAVAKAGMKQAPDRQAGRLWVSVDGLENRRRLRVIGGMLVEATIALGEFVVIVKEGEMREGEEGGNDPGGVA